MIARIHVLGAVAALLAACGQYPPSGGGGGTAMGTVSGAMSSSTAATAAAAAAAPNAPAVVPVMVETGSGVLAIVPWVLPDAGEPTAPGPEHVVAPLGPRAFPKGQAGLPGALPGRTLDEAGTPVDMGCVERVRLQAQALGVDEAAIRLMVATDCE